MGYFDDNKYINWEELFEKLKYPNVCANGEEYINITEGEIEALSDLAKFVAKMNPPEDPCIPPHIARDNDKKFKKFIDSQFKYLER